MQETTQTPQAAQHYPRPDPKAPPIPLGEPRPITIRSKRGRNSADPRAVQVRLPAEDLAALDAVVRKARERRLSVSRASVIADLVHYGLPPAETGCVHSAGTQVSIPLPLQELRAHCSMFGHTEPADMCRDTVQHVMELFDGHSDEDLLVGLERAALAFQSGAALRAKRMKPGASSRSPEENRTRVWVSGPQRDFLAKCANLMEPGEDAPGAIDEFATTESVYPGSMAMLLVYGAHVLG